jgi:hypothetical protein
VGKPGVAGVYTNQRLSLSKPWEGPRKIGQGFKPDPGNLAVRHYRGASRNVRHGETVTPSRNRKSGNGNPSPTARRARSLSQPWTMEKAKRARKAETPKQTSHSLRLRAPYLYPDPTATLGDHWCGAMPRTKEIMPKDEYRERRISSSLARSASCGGIAGVR